MLNLAEIIGVVSKLNCQTYKVAQFNRTNGMKLSQGGGQDVAVYSTNKGNMRKQFGNRNWKHFLQINDHETTNRSHFNFGPPSLVRTEKLILEQLH